MLKPPFNEKILARRDGTATAVCDWSTFPIVIFKPEGVWTERFIDFYFLQWRNPLAEYAKAQNKKIVSILDISNTPPPPATVRKYGAEHAKNDKNVEGLLKTVMIVSNPMLRGVMTAIVWMAGSDNVPLGNASDYPSAYRLARREFEAADIEAPMVSDDYKPPDADSLQVIAL